jgi:CHAT domain
MVTGNEWKAYEDHLARLDKAGEIEDGEKLVRRMLARLPEDDPRRAFTLTSLSLMQMRRSQYDDALSSSMEAVRLAHSRGDIGSLVLALDQRAHVRCFLQDYASAIRTLQEAKRYLEFGRFHNPEMNAALDHTWGLAYRGCGWWDAADRMMARVSDHHEHNRQWPEWALAFGDRVVVALSQAEAEGPEIERLRRLAEPFTKAREILAGHLSFTIQLAIHTLYIREYVARATNDLDELRRTRDEYTNLVLTYDGPGRPLRDPKFLGHRVAIALATARSDRTLIAGGRDVGHDPDDLLRSHSRILSLAVDRAPRSHELWRERAMVTLARVRRGHLPWSEAVPDAAHDLGTAVYHISDHADAFSDPGLRAGWLGGLGGLLYELAETASAALLEATPPLPDTAIRLLSLAQALRARARDDIVRSLESLRADDHGKDDAADLLARVRSLNRWLELLDEAGRTDDRSPCRGMKVLKAAAAPESDRPRNTTSILAEFVRTVDEDHPDYTHFRTRSDISQELNRSRERLGSLAARNVAVRVRFAGGRDEHMDLARWRADLSTGDVVLDYYLGPAGASVAVLGREFLDVVTLPLPDLGTLRRLVETHLTPDSADPTGQEARNRLLADGVRQCGEWLLPPRVFDTLVSVSAHRVHVVASGPLWRVPFGWLPAGDSLAMERWSVCLTPCARMAAVKPGPGIVPRAVAVAHSGFPPLLNVAAEARLVATVLGGAVVSQEAATPRRVLNDYLPEASVLHFGCHGIADPVTPWLAALQLAPDDQHRDGRLMLYEILERQCAADMVNLAACYTGRTEGPMSFPESLAHAWLGAGARFVIASLWPANDRECLAFAEDLYGEYRTSGDAMSAFHHAQICQLERLRAGARFEIVPPGSELYRTAYFTILGATTWE